MVKTCFKIAVITCLNQISAKRGSDSKLEVEANCKVMVPKSKRSSILIYLFLQYLYFFDRVIFPNSIKMYCFFPKCGGGGKRKGDFRN